MHKTTTDDKPWFKIDYVETKTWSVFCLANLMPSPPPLTGSQMWMCIWTTWGAWSNTNHWHNPSEIWIQAIRIHSESQEISRQSRWFWFEDLTLRKAALEHHSHSVLLGASTLASPADLFKTTTASLSPQSYWIRNSGVQHLTLISPLSVLMDIENHTLSEGLPEASKTDHTAPPEILAKWNIYYTAEIIFLHLHQGTHSVSLHIAKFHCPWQTQTGNQNA